MIKAWLMTFAQVPGRAAVVLAVVLTSAGCVVVQSGPSGPAPVPAPPVVRPLPPPPPPPPVVRGPEPRVITRVDVQVPAVVPAAPAAPPPVTPPAPGAVGEGVQTIVKLRDRNARVDRPDVLRRLTQAAGVEVVPVRPMSGDAWVVRLRVPAGTPYAQALQRLRASALVEYAEPDGIETIQPR